MKNIIQWLLCLLPIAALAQDKGVHFEQGLTWQQVQAKAKAEHKYIFMDCFTTWCGPCKYMSAQIFPQEAVGDLMNANFINVGVQLDTTDSDNEEVKSWYAAGHDIAKEYGIMAYPTFLIFDQNGKLVHRIVGAAQTGDEFIAKAKEALDPAKQYYPMLAKYKAGQKDSAFLYNLAMAALHAYDDKTGSQIANDYLATQSNIYTPKTLNLLQAFTQSSKDKGFQIMLQNPEKVDAVLGKGVAENGVNRIIFYEEVVPVLFNRYAPIAGEPNWNKLKDSVQLKYPAKANEVIAYSKVLFYMNRQQWNDFGPAIVAYMKSYGDNVSQGNLNEYAWTVFQNCSDENCLQSALEWSKRSFEKEQNPAYMDTYANILYRLGRKDEAIEWEQKAMDLVVNEAEKKGYQQTLDKMKAGEKTWN
ncbi:DUF255 domain-containing protein [Ilyomonas limi]|uniref:DUF255 domain-containing protein n=1 Tax=Ilyomonas limi TaxID=2575867 RepID=A0A4U3L6Y0_9BACT|nr:thioredoxin family protein [Ilyomonas limi]TKK70772.1 DUF255 domain-containing protein [Ilyomonas limi]